MTTCIRDPSDVAHWSQTVDVLVVGLGAAGAAAALEATACGAETLVLERAGGGGGTSAMSGGVIYLGGFILNDAMLEAHQPLARKCMFRVAADGDDGSGICLGVAAGGATMHMDAVSISLPVTQPWELKRGILVDAQGQRFVAEDSYMGRLGEFALFRAGGRAWLIVDDEVFEKPTFPREIAGSGETPAELEAELGLPPGSLESTLALYNRHAEQGEDPVFHKAAEYVKPLAKSPLGAFDCTVESSLYAAFTLGGLRTDVDGRVLDPVGDPIPGLFGAGRSTSGLAVGSYSSGLSLGDGTFFGRRAGRCAAQR